MEVALLAGFSGLCIGVGWLRLTSGQRDSRIAMFAIGFAVLLAATVFWTGQAVYYSTLPSNSLDPLWVAAWLAGLVAAAWIAVRAAARRAPGSPAWPGGRPLAWIAAALLLIIGAAAVSGLSDLELIPVVLFCLVAALAPARLARAAPAAVAVTGGSQLLSVIMPHLSAGMTWITLWVSSVSQSGSASGAVPNPASGRLAQHVHVSPPPWAGPAGYPGTAIGAAVVLLAAAWWLSPLARGNEPWLPPVLAAPDSGLAGRLQQLAATRADAVDSATAELRRIERDLHDGAQARLVAVGMSLGAAQRLIATQPAAAAELVGEAREASARALSELRDVLRGISPPVLADRGLADAIRALALDTPLRTGLDLGLPARLPAPVETAAYFAVAEALANAAKHAGARAVHIRARHDGGTLRIEVTDDGAGGADPAAGTGLRGLERRLATLDGILAVSSPPGGPTIVVIEVPCALSSPKTSTC